eukprot:TRINITY_DN18524_c0_g1_i4.p1 TRINITY_DN18524_c0_g1~~TRINITY_DN18524_c0_g1_i4.p1  ORF type:complete len:197 (-),score=30.97 TRINITY_DN18524_c0_g1_i4:64-654(-)
MSSSGAWGNDIKFILPERTADSWYASAEATVLAGWTRPPGPGSKHSQRMARIVWSPLFGESRLSLPEQKQVAKQRYDDHIAAVLREVPPQALLRWRPEEGWSGLCEFLGVPAVDVEFPQQNHRERGFEWKPPPDQEKIRMASLRGVAFLMMMVLPCVPAMCICGYFRPSFDSTDSTGLLEDEDDVFSALPGNKKTL